MEFNMNANANHNGQSGCSRRNVLRGAAATAVWLAAPAAAFDVFKLLDPEGKSEDLNKAKQILRGAGSIAAGVTDMDYASELAVGESLALEGLRRYGLPVNQQGLQTYVNLLGRAVARNSDRSQIPYYFVVVNSHVYNAFACPGGIVFVTSALMRLMADESDLACILAHEIAHVSHKHALSSLRRAKLIAGLGQITAATMSQADAADLKQMIDGLQTVLFDQGLDKNMEFDADVSGMDFAYRTGYDPRGLIRVLEQLQRQHQASNQPGSWFSTHPPLSARLKACRDKLAEFPDAPNMARAPARFQQHAQSLQAG